MNTIRSYEIPLLEALEYLKKLVESGKEFPDAVFSVYIKFKLNPNSLARVIESYDSGINEAR